MYLTPLERKNFFLYLLFNVVVLIVNLLMVSIVAFFHFQLSHQLGDIENWLSGNAWPIIILVKLSCFILFFVFYTVGPESYLSRLKGFIKKSNLIPSSAVVIVCISIYFLISSMGSYVDRNTILSFFDLHKFLSFSGTTVFYLVDFLVLYILYFNKERRVRELLMTTALFYLFSRFVIPYKDHITVMIALHFFTLLTFSRKNNLGDPLFYLFFVVGIFSVLWGLDPIWGAEFAFFKLELIDIAFYYVACWCLCIGYYLYKNKEQKELVAL